MVAQMGYVETDLLDSEDLRAYGRARRATERLAKTSRASRLRASIVRAFRSAEQARFEALAARPLPDRDVTTSNGVW